MNALSILVLVFYRIDKDTHERNVATLSEAAAVAEEAHLTRPSRWSPARSENAGFPRRASAPAN